MAAFEDVLQRTNGSVDLVLLDRVGQPGNERGYLWSEVYQRIADRIGQFKITVMSAYRSGVDESAGRSLNIVPKTQSSLVEILSRTIVRGPSLLASLGDRNKSRRDSDTAHVLVTGAGFEIGSTSDGLGLPPTGKILRDMYKRMATELEPLKWMKVFPTQDEAAFPVVNVKNPKARKHNNRFRSAAENRDLDRYFSLLFHGIRNWTGSQGAIGGLELNFRKQFRSALLQYDWGHLYQCAIAARLPWLAWISTNYMGFADRAIEAVAPEELPGGWEIVAGREDARHVLDRMLDEKYNERARPAQTSSDGRNSQVLFKVHGHVGDVRTMALAADDKRTNSLLAVPVKSLYQLYAAAEQFLLARLRFHKKVVFHVVGHNLRDKNLVSLLREVWRYSQVLQKEVSFVLVNPSIFDTEEGGPDRDGLLSRLYYDLVEDTKSGDVNLCILPMTAREYLSRLAWAWDDLSCGGPQFREEYQRIMHYDWPWRTFPRSESVMRQCVDAKKFAETASAGRAR